MTGYIQYMGTGEYLWSTSVVYHLHTKRYSRKMNPISAFTEMFVTHGLRFAVVVLSCGIAYMFRIFLKMRDQHLESERVNIRVLENVRISIDALVKSREEDRNTVRVMVGMQASIDALTKSVDNLERRKPGG